MKCLHCDNDKFQEKYLCFTPEIKGEQIEVTAAAFACTQCQEPLMNDTQMNAFRKAAADKYRKLHNLLTSDEIIAFRSVLGMSQTAFANYLKVGEASVKRWETYYVQDVGQDEHIRLKCDEAYAEFNALEVHWKSHPPDEFSGNKRFSLELFKQVVSYLIQFAKSPLFLNKALFYVDFKHFQLYNTGITGTRYVHLEYGPCPDQYQNLIQYLIKEHVLISKGHHELKSVEKADLHVFSDSEQSVLHLIADCAKSDGGKNLLRLSHQEQAYKKTEPMQYISYQFAKKLKI